MNWLMIGGLLLCAFGYIMPGIILIVVGMIGLID